MKEDKTQEAKAKGLTVTPPSEPPPEGYQWYYEKAASDEVSTQSRWILISG